MVKVKKSTSPKKATKRTTKSTKKKAPKRSAAKKKTSTTKTSAPKKTKKKSSTKKKVAKKSSASTSKRATKKRASTAAKAKDNEATNEELNPSELEVTVDRRGSKGEDRRDGKDRRQQTMAVENDRRSNPERREKVARRRQIDPTTCERDYTGDEIEFMHALDEYKRKAGRMFPTCSEILEVVRGLGYRRLTPEELAILNPPQAPVIADEAGETNALTGDLSQPLGGSDSEENSISPTGQPVIDDVPQVPANAAASLGFGFGAVGGAASYVDVDTETESSLPSTSADPFSASHEFSENYDEFSM